MNVNYKSATAMCSKINDQPRQDFAYRHLENNLVYISESIIREIKSGNCEIKFWDDASDIGEAVGLSVDLEKSFVEMIVEINCPNSYLVRLWSKGSSPSEEDKKCWYNKEGSCPGHLVWECCNTDLVSEEEMETHHFDTGLQRLVAKYIGTNQEGLFVCW
ncbi:MULTISPECIES: hypothetical protein [unclassified Nostoc]|uniref:hypothetical protein n=1 Tax=unclassified Nostoc TaxID=2593658 RepID=UPI002AD33899|nr:MULTISPECIES: hypothetical protein [unclassified Nostoc]MDZ7986542.1 hypothetical protein [Nostoc sp. DedVER02]MDZ8113929.1 hypothetical protein [Nostoc sp. DedVER01b]